MVETGFEVIGLDFSPIKGPQGNIEYLAYIKKSSTPKLNNDIDADLVVDNSHLLLDK